MAEATLTLGGSLDIASGAEVQKHFTDLNSKMDAWHYGAAERKAIRKYYGGAVNGAAGGTNLCYFQATPPANCEWWIKRIALGVNDDHTQATFSTTQSVNAITLGATGVAAYNNNSVGVFATVSGGVVTQIAINGTNTNLTSGTFYVPAGGTITVTYSTTPTLTTVGPTVTSNVSAALYGGDPFNPNVMQCKVPGMQPLPYWNEWGDARIVIKPTEYLFVNFYNVVAGSLLWANVEIDEIPIKFAERTSS